MSNHAAVFNGNKDPKYNFFTIEEVPKPSSVPANRILIKAEAYAANPTDWKHFVFGLGKKGVIGGSDVAGVVEEVGSDVKGFAKGDYVALWQHGNFEEGKGSFQDFVIIDPILTIKLDKTIFRSDEKPLAVGPSTLGFVDTFEGAASLALGLSTVGMSFANQLKLKADDPTNKDSYILIWGGATATGVLAIQVAKHIYGLKVIATASLKHEDFLKSLGADAVVDYNDKLAVTIIKSVGGSNIKYALDTVLTKETFQSVYDATADTDNVRFDNLLGLDGDSIKTDPSRKVALWGKTLAYVVNGEPFDGFAFTTKPTPGLAEDYGHFWHELLPAFLPKLKHSNLRVLAPGLALANEALYLLANNEVSGEKVVWRSEQDV